MEKKMYCAIDINNPYTWDKIDDDNDDYDRLRNIIANIEDYFEIDDIYDMRVEDLMIYVREMVRGGNDNVQI